MTDVMKHLLVGVQIIPADRLDRGDAQARRDWVDRVIGQDAGTLIVGRWPTTVTTDDEGNERRELRVYVFGPEELAQYTSNVRDTAIAEVMALADEIVDKPPTLENDA